MTSHDIRPGEESPAEPTATAETIRAFLVSRVARMARLPEEKVDVNAPISSFGVDSVHTVELIVEIEDWLEVSVPDDLPMNHPTIAALAQVLCAEGAPAAGAGEPEGSAAA